MSMYDEEYGRPKCGYSSSFYCFIGSLRVPVFVFLSFYVVPMLRIESPDSFSL